MRYDLFDYQREAALGVLNRMRRARADWIGHQSLSAFALSAVTGAGKTVIATAVIEGILHGSADLEVSADARAAFLWVTDDPALNRQTRNKMLAASDVLNPGRLIILDNDYLGADLRAGVVYFLNIQKLSKTSGFAHGDSNLRQHSGWEVIGNTISGGSVDLYLVLDEAHRGMKQATDRASIVQRIIGGQAGSNPPAPIVWGISATIERFTTAMRAHEATRTTYPPVNVDIDKVRASGIVKDQIDLNEPNEAGSFSATLLRSAVDSTLDFERRWATYSKTESEPEVLPVLVIQVADKTSEASLAELISVIEEQWPGLGPDAIANVFGEHDDLVIARRKVCWVPPESIQAAGNIRVVLAKEAISTGWDCPRAEVLYSERAANDSTHIAQVIGRMVRSPLAHRITTDDALNAVTCFLPRFNRTALERVIDELTRPGEPGAASDIVISARPFPRNTAFDESVFRFVEELPSWPKPDQLASPLRRAKALAKLLTDDASGRALLPNAGEQLATVLNAKLDGLAAEYKSAVATNVQNLETAELRRTTVTIVGEPVAVGTWHAPTATRDIDQETRRIIGSVKEGVAKDYVRYLVEQAGTHADILGIRTQVAGLLQVDSVIAEIEDVATKWARSQFTRFAAEIKNTTGAIKDAFMRVREQTSEQEETGIELPITLNAATKDSKGSNATDLPTFVGHLFADANGLFPAKFNDWESDVITQEIARRSFVAWYRNPSRAGPSSQRVGYQKDDGEWGSLQVDFIVVSRRDDGTLGASIIDPHSTHLADSRAKLVGLARFAEKFGDRFVRIESIAKTSQGNLRSLDLLDASVRDVIRTFEGGKVSSLYESAHAYDYR